MRAGTRFTLFILNDGMNDIFKIIKSIEDLGVLINGVVEAVKYEIKKTRSQIYWSLVSTFSGFNKVTCDCFSGKLYKWKEKLEE